MLHSVQLLNPKPDCHVPLRGISAASVTNSTAPDSRGGGCCQFLGTNCGLQQHISITWCLLPPELHHLTSHNKVNSLELWRKCAPVLLIYLNLALVLATAQHHLVMQLERW